MMYKLLLTGLIACLGSTLLVAQELNIFTKNENAKIFINEDLIGYGAVKNYTVKTGSHYVRVQVGKHDIYTKLVELEDGRTETIAVDRFVGVESPVPNRGAVLEEAKRAMDGRGNIAVGLNGSYLPGLSIKGNFTRKLGMQATGWMFSFNDQRYTTWELRAHYNIVNTLLNRMPGSLYLVSGYGRRSTTNDEQSYFDVALGVEFSLAPSRQNTELIVHDGESLAAALISSFLFLDNAYLSGELGFGSIDADDGNPEYQGVIGRIGLHYYF